MIASVEIRTPGPEWTLVALAVWFGDPWAGDWEFRMHPEDAALRRRLDDCYEAHVDAYAGMDFGALSGKTAPAWTSFEGLVGALRLALPSAGLRCGAVAYPAAVVGPAPPDTTTEV